MNSHHYQSVLPDNSSPLMRAIEKAFRAQLEAVNEPFPQLLNPALTPAQFLSALASEVGVKDWFESDTVSEQRSIVGNGLIIQKEAGTRAGLKRAAESIGVDATVTPWFKTDDGKPYEFYIDAYIEDDETLDALAFERLSARIFHHKSERDLWLVTFKHDPSLGSAYAAPVIRTRKRWVSNSVVPPHVVSVTITADDYELYEHEREMIVSATVIMSDGSINSDVIYISSDESIVTVDNAGRVRFVAEGVAVISAISTFDNISRDECVITTFAISFVLEVGKDGGGNVGYMSNTAGGVQPDDWCASSPAKIGYLQYIRSGDVAFSTASPKHWSLLWNDFVSVKFKFANESDNHTSELLQQSESANYRAQSDIDTYNFLSRIVGSHVNVYVKNGESSNVQ
ncbi:phage tail protein I [Vibrio parahaemolyticus]|uniref:phage tail protein I n=1 Tax=Vibrio parahaemolyticus TaxID=670 RepID=UPI00111F4E3C|nr:phage tail protein I [Vibrio parahaemolyticus]TOG92699.1 phage tail protein I [Vibrio parahaemolyticus]